MKFYYCKQIFYLKLCYIIWEYEPDIEEIVNKVIVSREKAKAPCTPKQTEYTSDFDDNISQLKKNKKLVIGNRYPKKAIRKQKKTNRIGQQNFYQFANKWFNGLG